MKKLMMSMTMITGMLLVLPFQGQAQECQDEKTKEKKNQAQLTECASKEGYAKATFQVDGNCSMCKERIEKAANQVDGVKKASWDKQSDQLSLAYHKEKTQLMDVHNKIAAAGHDTKKVTATGDAYAALPNCCKYREEQ